MRLRIIVWLAIALVAWLPSLVSCRDSAERGRPVSVVGAPELRVMSFNLRYENPDDRGGFSWRNRLPAVVGMLRCEAPDILGVQEALHGQAADLWASLPEYALFGVGRDDGLRAGEYAAVLYRRDRFDVDSGDCGEFWLSDTPEVAGSKTWGNRIPRMVTWLRLTDRVTGRSFYVYNTHWDHQNQESRERSALLMSERIDHRKSRDLPVLVLGDFNAVSGNPAVAYLNGVGVRLSGRECRWERPLVDVDRELHPRIPARTSLHFWQGSLAKPLKVDHIFASKGVLALSSSVRQDDRPLVSDHFPVTAVLRIP